MPTLSGNQTGTSDNDLFAGSVDFAQNQAGSNEAIGFGFKDATVLAKEGDDNIQGTAQVDIGPDITGTATAVGFDKTKVFAGTGNDTVFAVGNARDLQGNGSASGFGFRDTAAFGDDGDDTFLISGFSQSNQTSGGGFVRSFIDAGGGADLISLDYAGVAAPAEDPLDAPSSGTGLGTDGAGIRAGAGNDQIEITASVRAERFSFNASNSAVVQGAKDTLEINGGGDDDVMTTTATAVGVQAKSTALDNSRMLGEDGNDTLEVTANAEGLTLASAIALDRGSRVSGNAGDDIIRIVSDASSGGPLASSTEAYGLRSSSLSGGSGADTVEINVTGFDVDDGLAVGAEDSGIDLSEGNDTLTINVSGFGNASGTGIGINKATILGGSGNDTIDIFAEASGEDSILGDATGAKSSRIYAGIGDDTIKIRASVGFGNVDIDDMLLAGDDGDDTFDVGVGSGRIKGGSGTDTAILDFLGPELLGNTELSVTESRGSVQITSNLDTFGFGDSTLSWTQSFRGVEVFKVAGVDYTASELAATFG